MPRSFILVLDSLGIGASPDAPRFGDEGANTLGHIADWRMAQGRPLRIPQLEQLGLGAAMRLATGAWPAGLLRRSGFTAAYAAAQERSLGKDTPSGHWEMTGVPVDFDWGYFPPPDPCFPPDLLADWTQRCGLPGLLGNCHASGTEIIARLGDEHVATGFPIIYTSGDSVFQVAAHESHFGLDRLYQICQVAFELLRPYRIARVIARPFTGAAGAYRRTANRKDIAVPPPGETLLDLAQRHGREVIAIGKIGDIFAMRGITRLVKAPDNMALFDALLEQAEQASDGAIVFANFVDFDQNFGHRRDTAGYADALEAFDARLPRFMELLRPHDLCAFTADHGCDPTWPGTDHTREYVPQLFTGPGMSAATGRSQASSHRSPQVEGTQVSAGPLGVRTSFCDLGQAVARHLGLPPLTHGTSPLVFN